MSVNEFLVLTQQEILPFLVLHKKKDILQRVALARGQGLTIKEICSSPSANLAAIIAHLLGCGSADPEADAISCLVEVGLDADLTSLIKCDPVMIACEMLKADEDVASDDKQEVRLCVCA